MPGEHYNCSVLIPGPLIPTWTSEEHYESCRPDPPVEHSYTRMGRLSWREALLHTKPANKQNRFSAYRSLLAFGNASRRPDARHRHYGRHVGSTADQADPPGGGGGGRGHLQ